MLTINGPRDHRRLCKGVTRRDTLRIGALGALGMLSGGGVQLADLLAADSQHVNRRHKSVIMIYMCGGPPHQDMYEIKEDAPTEVRGPFDAIPTNVPGIRISEKLPKMAAMMDKLAPIRSMVGARDSHYSYQCMTGHHDRQAPAGGWPHFGSAVSHFQGPVTPGTPPFVSLCYTTQHRPYNEPGPGFLGLGHSSFSPKGPGRGDLVLNGITSERLGDRRQLLQSFDQFRREADAAGKMSGMDTFTERHPSKVEDSHSSSPQSAGDWTPFGGDTWAPRTRKRRPMKLSGVQFAMPILPPGLQTRTISDAACAWFGANITPNVDTTASKLSSAKGKASASACSKATARFSARARALPFSKSVVT